MAKSPFKLGDDVRQAIPIISGKIIDIEIDRVSGERKFLVEFPDPNDEDGDGKLTTNRWFDESHLELVPPQPAPAVAPVAPTQAPAVTPAPSTSIARTSKLTGA